MASEIKVNKVSPATGTALQISDSGDTVTLPSGATLTIAGTANVTGTLSNNGTATGFGSIDWQTSDIKTSTFTAAAGKGYFVNTTSGAVTVNLPAGSAGTQIAFADYAGTWDTNACTLAPNGSEKIEGTVQDVDLENERESITIIYQDSTQGWIAISNSDGKVTNPKYISATGGTITTSGDFKIHTFTGTGTFTVSSVGNSTGGGALVSYQVIAGGGGGGTNNPASSTGGGGGGAGGYREGRASNDSYTVSPLNAPAGLTVSAQGYPITVGGGGAGTGDPGTVSTFSTITSAGGGNGASYQQNYTGANGGSGGGGAYARNGGSGNTPPVSPPQGSNGAGSSPPSFRAGGGGGGATSAGAGAAPSSGGGGGTGATSHIPGSPTALAGGGGGGGGQFGDAAGGPSNSGGGAGAANGPGANGSNGTDNTGGGGGGAGGQTASNGGAGGSGKVVIRYKYQN